jgi:flagellar biosynthesis/type III secretory pathway protein FliH
MKFAIFLKRPDGVYKVSGFESRITEASTQLALYLFRHYPVSFFDDKLDEEGKDTEKILRDSRNGFIIWRQGDMECKMPEGFFYVDAEKEKKQDEKWWQASSPKTKKLVIEVDINEAYQKGFSEGFAKGLDSGRDEGYRQGVLDSAANPYLN